MYIIIFPQTFDASDAHGYAFWIYYYSLVVIGSFFMLNLVLGVLSGLVFLKSVSLPVMYTKDIHSQVPINTLDQYAQSTPDQYLIDTWVDTWLILGLYLGRRSVKSWVNLTHWSIQWILDQFNEAVNTLQYINQHLIKCQLGFDRDTEWVLT